MTENVLVYKELIALSCKKAYCPEINTYTFIMFSRLLFPLGKGHTEVNPDFLPFVSFCWGFFGIFDDKDLHHARSHVSYTSCDVKVESQRRSTFSATEKTWWHNTVASLHVDPLLI